MIDSNEDARMWKEFEEQERKKKLKKDYLPLQKEIEIWQEIKQFIDYYLKRDVINENKPLTILETLEKQHKEIKELKKALNEAHADLGETW